jgi:hypothetical protein
MKSFSLKNAALLPEFVMPTRKEKLSQEVLFSIFEMAKIFQKHVKTFSKHISFLFFGRGEAPFRSF